jgi:hypothetical protein
MNGEGATNWESIETAKYRVQAEKQGIAGVHKVT